MGMLIVALIIAAKFFCFGMCAYYLYKWLSGRTSKNSEPYILEQNNYTQQNVILTDEQVAWFFSGRKDCNVQEIEREN